MTNPIRKNLALAFVACYVLLVIGCSPALSHASKETVSADQSAGSTVDPRAAHPEAVGLETLAAEVGALFPVMPPIPSQSRGVSVASDDVTPNALSDIGVMPASHVEEAGTTSTSKHVTVVCPPVFRPGLSDWLARRARQGWKVKVVDSQASAEQLKATLASDSHTSHILLVGDSMHTPMQEPSDPLRYVPTMYERADVTAPYQDTPALPGDWRYGDFDDDGFLEASVGRLPVTSVTELSDFVKRVIRYEDQSIHGDWYGRVDLIAGIGGFGAMIDGAIEMVAGGIITGGLPPYVQTRITHASPTSIYHPGIDRFTDQVLANYQSGSRFWVYAGHGWVNELDRVPAGMQGRPVLAMDDVPRLRSDSPPIALLLACYTGAFDLAQDCLAEQMLLSSHGPIAVLAGSRVTMPYGNASVAMGLIHSVYKTRANTLGDAWRQAINEISTESHDDQSLKNRRAMVDGIASLMGGGSRMPDERREHRQLYNYLGDPTLVLHSSQELELQPIDNLRIGQPVTIRGTAPHAGELVLEVHRRPAAQLPTGMTDSIKNLTVEDKYRIANQTLIFSDKQFVEAGEWSASMTIAPDEAIAGSSSTAVVIKAVIKSERDSAVGAQVTWLRPATQTKKQD